MTNQTKDRIGRMRLRFVIETPVEAATALGGALITWQAGAAFWGRIEARSSSEPVTAERVVPRIVTRIRTRFRTGLVAGMRLRAGARLFDIEGAFDPDGRREWLAIEAYEVAA